jgi:hypothetical protein
MNAQTSKCAEVLSKKQALVQFENCRTELRKIANTTTRVNAIPTLLALIAITAARSHKHHHVVYRHFLKIFLCGAIFDFWFVPS